MPWATDAEIKAAVAAAVKRGAATLPPDVDGIVARRLVTAREQLRNYLYAHGYTEAQLLTWSGLDDFHRDQAAFWCLDVDLRGMFKDAEGAAIQRLNRLDELMRLEALYTAGGVEIEPANPAEEGGASSGTFASRADFDAQRARERAGPCPAGDWAYRR